MILNNCNSLYLSKNSKSSDRPEVYEALIEDKSKNIIYLKLSADTVKELSLKHEDEVKVDIQFQPNRLTYCEWHMAVDKIADYKIIFPDTKIGPDIPWNPKRQWDATLDQKLNSKQKEAVVTITSPINIPLPPILLIGEDCSSHFAYSLIRICLRSLRYRQDLHSGSNHQAAAISKRSSHSHLHALELGCRFVYSRVPAPVGGEWNCRCEAAANLLP